MAVYLFSVNTCLKTVFSCGLAGALSLTFFAFLSALTKAFPVFTVLIVSLIGILH